MRYLQMALLGLVAFFQLLCGPAGAQYFPAGPSGWADTKAEDHWALDFDGGNAGWVKILVPPVIRHDGDFRRWFSTEVPRIIDSVWAPATSRSNIDTLRWRPLGQPTLAFDSVIVRDGERFTVTTIGYATGYGTQLICVLFPPPLTGASPQVKQAFEYAASIRDWGFRLTIDMLKDASTADASESTPANPPASPPAGKKSTSASKPGRNCRNYQTGSYPSTRTNCTNQGCSQTTTYIPVYSYVCTD